MKERNKAYKLDEMLPGERFYFIRDRKKVAWQLSDTMPFEIKNQIGYRIQYANCRQGSESIHTNVQFKTTNCWVIYLRNQ